jgi:hypothetical protein
VEIKKKIRRGKRIREREGREDAKVRRENAERKKEGK